MNKWTKHLSDPNSIPISQVVSVMEVYIADTKAHTGSLKRPSHEQLVDAFGSYRFDDIFPFMVTNGRIQPCGKHSDLKGKEKG